MKKLSFENMVRKGLMRRVVLCAFLISHFSFRQSVLSLRLVASNNSSNRLSRNSRGSRRRIRV